MLDTILEAAILIVVFLEYLESMKMRKLMEKEPKTKNGTRPYIDPMGDRIGF